VRPKNKRAERLMPLGPPQTHQEPARTPGGSPSAACAEQTRDLCSR
jgi:hypothetical protein